MHLKISEANFTIALMRDFYNLIILNLKKISFKILNVDAN